MSTDPTHDVDQAELTELVSFVPLLAKARAHLGRRVTVHVAGNLSVDGLLVDVDDEDATITVVDGDDRYEIAAQAVAVLHTKARRR